MMWTQDGKIRMKKGFMHLMDFMDFWKTKEWNEVPAILHFRIATHGGINSKNTHPFWVFPKKLAFVHNGIFYFEDPKDKISDTQIFNRHVLKQLPRNFLSNTGFRILLEDFVGVSSKLAFLSSDGEIDIFNEDGGTWGDDGCWFSNMHWQPSAIGSWKKPKDEEPFSEIEDHDISHTIPWDSYSDPRSIETPRPSDVRYERWFCYTCKDDFSWEDAFEWVSYNNEQLPECPICNSPENVFGIGENGLWVEDVLIGGTNNYLEWDEVNDDIT